MPDRQPDTRPMLDRMLKHRAAFTKTVSGIERAIELRSVSRPLLDLVEIADVRNERVVDFVV